MCSLFYTVVSGISGQNQKQITHTLIKKVKEAPKLQKEKKINVFNVQKVTTQRVNETKCEYR